jgi:hypothetical protein
MARPSSGRIAPAGDYTPMVRAQKLSRDEGLKEMCPEATQAEMTKPGKAL